MTNQKFNALVGKYSRELPLTRTGYGVTLWMNEMKVPAEEDVHPDTLQMLKRRGTNPGRTILGGFAVYTYWVEGGG